MKPSPLAVVLVAGISRRLMPLTESLPKCLLEVGDKTILDHQLTALKAAGITEVVFVLGYRREQIMDHVTAHHPEITARWVINHHFFETNTSYSLWLVRELFRDRDFVYFNGDVLFEPRLLQRVLDAEAPNSLAVEAKPVGPEEVKVLTDDDGRIRRIGKKLPYGESLGEFIGVARFGAATTPAFIDALQALVDGGRSGDYFEAALDQIADAERLQVTDVTDLPVIEIDFAEDYARACEEVLARFGAR